MVIGQWNFVYFHSDANARLQLLPEAGVRDERRLEAVRFRVKAPVPRRPPHRPGRAQ